MLTLIYSRIDTVQHVKRHNSPNRAINTMAFKTLMGTHVLPSPKHCRIFILAALVFLCSNLSAQVDQISVINITTATPTFSSYTQTAPNDAGTGVTAGVNYTVRNGVDATGVAGTGDNDVVISYEINSTVFNNFVKPDTFALKRTDGGNFVNIWYEMAEDAATSYDLVPEATTDADAIYLLDALNAGYDNILVNEDDLAGNTIQAQIERVDVIWYNGVVTSTPENAVFTIIERGGNDQVKIAAILSLDSNNEPASYSNMVTINGDEAGTTNDWPGTGVTYNEFLILRRQALGDDPLPLLELGSQTVQGVAVAFDELNISANQVVFGYSIFASDVDDTDPDVDLTDINTFPTGTLSSVSGLDLIASTTAAVASDDELTRAEGPGGYKAALATWLKANETADVTTSTDGSPVSDWQDHWIGDNDFSTGFGDPSYVDDNTGVGIQNINFNQSVDFSGSTSLTTPNNEDFNITGLTSPNNFYAKKGINIAFRTDATDITTRQVIYEQGGGTRGIIFYIENGSVLLSAWNREATDGGGVGSPWNDGAIQTVSASIAANTEYIITLELDGNNTSTGTLSGYLNGAFMGDLQNVGLLYDHNGDIELGASGGGAQYPDGSSNADNYFEGEIAEFIYCNEPGSFLLSQRNRIESYLALKYGITLDQNSSQQNYFNADGDIIYNTNLGTALGGFEDYDFDIAGIARDDKSEFEQLRSRSENQNSVVTIERATSFPSDETFLIWGNDNGSNDETATDLPSLINQRTTRIWRVSETGESGDVSISFDLSELAFTITGSTPGQDDFSLLVAPSSANGSMTGATVITGGTVSGNTLTFNNVNLAAGEFFTIGTGFISCSPGGVDTNLEIWLRANLGTSTTVNGATVTTWSDQAGSNDATAFNSPAYNTNVINFNPSVDFSATDNDYMTIPDGSLPDFENQFLAVVGSHTDASVGYSPYIIKTETWNWSEGWGIATDNEVSQLEYHRDAYTGTNFVDPGFNNPSLLTAWTDGSNDTFSYDYGTGQINPASGTNSNDTSNDITIAASPDGVDVALPARRDYLDGTISEIVVYSDDLTSVERQRVASYLAIKYGVTIGETGTGGNYLASDGGIIWDRSTNTGYNNDITGIGRDDDSCLSQKQSKSNNDASIVTIGNGSIESDNVSNLNTFSTDDSFLIWGNDAAATTSQNTDVPTGVADRITRVWRVQETGTVGNTTISFDLTGLGYGNNASNFKLIVSPSASGGTMASGTTFSGGTLNGDVITFNNIDFNNGDYFTLGVTNSITCGPGGITANLDYWLKGDVGTGTTTDGNVLGTWADQSSSGRNASEVDLGGSVPVEPLYQTDEFNFNPAIQFTDPNSSNAAYMASSTGTNVTGNLSLITVFSTGQAGGSTTDFEAAPTFLSNGDSDSDQDYGLGITDGRVHMNASNDDDLDARSPDGTTYNDFEPYIFVGTRQQAATAGSIQLYVNGENVANGTSTNTALSGNNNSAQYAIGNHDDGNQASQFQGFIAESIVFGQELSAADRNKVETYLAVKYGITKNNNGLNYVSSGDTDIWVYAEDAGYNSDIAGIGRDDNSCFTQLKSKSENNDALVTMEINSLANDDSWLLWANDNVQIEGTRDEGNIEYDPTEINSRLFREWRVQESGTVGTVTITYDLSTVTGPSGLGTNNLNQVRLMVDSDGDFTSATTYISPSSIDAVNKTVSFEVDFNDGDYYTLGSQEVAALPITLIAFEAKPTADQKVQLTWTTADESNNSYFTIERSANGTDFVPLARMDGAGNSTTLINYQYLDALPLNGFNFYRLKQTDFSGEYSYSEVRAINIELAGLNTVWLDTNPVDKGESIVVNYRFEEEEELQFNLITTSGIQLLYEPIEVTGTSGVLELNTTSMPKGLNIVQAVSKSGQKYSLKVIIR